MYTYTQRDGPASFFSFHIPSFPSANDYIVGVNRVCFEAKTTTQVRRSERGTNFREVIGDKSGIGGRNGSEPQIEIW